MKECDKIAVCISTYNRPLGLERLLISLSRLEFNKTPTPNWWIVVADNNTNMPVKGLIDSIRLDFPVVIQYGLEPRKGIPSARNLAVKLAGEVDFIAFIDDDEVAAPNWLDELLYVQNLYHADVVRGPVIARFEEKEPQWVKKGGFYERPRYSTGTTLEYIALATGNVLIKHKWLQIVHGPFDEDMNLSGGSDTLFFAQISKLGAKFFWADTACVWEYQPPSRVSARWLIMRSFRTGIATSIVHRKVFKSFMTIMIRILKSIIRFLIGVFLLIPLSFIYGFAGTIRGLRMITQGCGEIGGFLGIRYLEYKNVHGS